MSIDLKIFDHDSQPMFAGVCMELLSDDIVVATATTNDEGVASFDYVPAADEVLAVRLERGATVPAGIPI